MIKGSLPRGANEGRLAALGKAAYLKPSVRRHMHDCLRRCDGFCQTCTSSCKLHTDFMPHTVRYSESKASHKGGYLLIRQPSSMAFKAFFPTTRPSLATTLPAPTHCLFRVTMVRAPAHGPSYDPKLPAPTHGPSDDDELPSYSPDLLVVLPFDDGNADDAFGIGKTPFR